MRSVSDGSVVERNDRRNFSMRLSISTQDLHMLGPFSQEKRASGDRSQAPFPSQWVALIWGTFFEFCTIPVQLPA